MLQFFAEHELFSSALGSARPAWQMMQMNESERDDMCIMIRVLKCIQFNELEAFACAIFFIAVFLSEVWKQLKTTALEISLSIYICVMCERAAQNSEKATDMLGDCQERKIVELTTSSVTSVRVAV